VWRSAGRGAVDIQEYKPGDDLGLLVISTVRGGMASIAKDQMRSLISAGNRGSLKKGKV
jgi:hypothetical protein